MIALEDGEIRRLGGERTLRVNTRVMAATGGDLDHAVRESRFRRDLYHRLLVLAFRLPPLRERGDDLEAFARLFLDHFSQKYGRPILGYHAAALDRLLACPWPGNIRELAHTIEAAVLACDGGRISIHHLPPSLAHPGAVPPAPPLQPPNGRYSFYGSPADEKRQIQEALRRCRGNKTQAAAALGMARNTLRLKLRSLGLDGPRPLG